MILKAFCLISLVSILCCAIQAQTSEWLWFQSAGGDQYDGVEKIATDPSGNIYVTGYYEGNASFGSITIPGHAYQDAYVAKIDPQGNWQWAKDIGSDLFDEGNGITVDSDGYIYAVGRIATNASFGPINVSVPYGMVASYIAKLDAAGSWQWVRPLLYTADNNTLGFRNVAVAADGSIFVNGGFSGTVSFGTHTLTSYGQGDVFLAKMDAAGNWLWADRMGGVNTEYCGGLGLDVMGNAYSSGNFPGNAQIGAFSLTSVGYSDVFIAKHNPAGECLWALSCGGSGDIDTNRGIAVNNSGETCLTSSFEGTGTFGTFVLPSNGGRDIAITKLDADGNWLWAQNAGGTGDEYDYGVAWGSQDCLFVTGRFQNSVNFGAFNLTSISYADVFLVKLDAAGNYLEAVSASSEGGGEPKCLAVDAQTNAYIAGAYNMPFTLGDIYVPDPGEMNLYVAKYGILVSVHDEVSPVLEAFAAAYPNPFAENLSLAFDRDAVNILNARIYNLKGQLVRETGLWISTDGCASVWDGRDDSGRRCPEGVYLLWLQTDCGTPLVKRVTLIDRQ